MTTPSSWLTTPEDTATGPISRHQNVPNVNEGLFYACHRVKDPVLERNECGEWQEHNQNRLTSAARGDGFTAPAPTGGQNMGMGRR